MPDEYVHVSAHAHILASGRNVGPGDRINPQELTDEDQHLLDEGHLADVDGFGSNSNEPVTDQGDDLKVRAQALNIPGRSKMSADELRAAIADAESKETV